MVSWAETRRLLSPLILLSLARVLMRVLAAELLLLAVLVGRRGHAEDPYRLPWACARPAHQGSRVEHCE